MWWHPFVFRAPFSAKQHLLSGCADHLQHFLALTTYLLNFAKRIRHQKTKRPPGNWAAFSSRENSSNGGNKSRQNFLPKSYEPKNGGVKRFLRNK
jgi:hypothetical protein